MLHTRLDGKSMIQQRKRDIDFLKNVNGVNLNQIRH